MRTNLLLLNARQKESTTKANKNVANFCDFACECANLRNSSLQLEPEAEYECESETEPEARHSIVKFQMGMLGGGWLKSELQISVLVSR